VICEFDELSTGVGTRSPKFAGPGFKRPLVVGLQVLEVGDGTSMWGPHGSELSYGTQLSEKGERSRSGGNEDISPEFADKAPVRGAGVACHVSKCGKNVTQTFLHWYSCRCHYKNDNLTSIIRYNGKNIKTPRISRQLAKAKI
jgi:hypothetical protein